MTTTGACPIRGNGRRNDDWWPHQVDLDPLRKYSPAGSPEDDDFDHARAGQQRFASLNPRPDNANLNKARRLVQSIKAT